MSLYRNWFGLWRWWKSSSTQGLALASGAQGQRAGRLCHRCHGNGKSARQWWTSTRSSRIKCSRTKGARCANGRSTYGAPSRIGIIWLDVATRTISRRVKNINAMQRRWRSIAEIFMSAFFMRCGPEHVTMCMHIMQCHCHELIKQHGSLDKFCGQGAEAIH
jgi:hypothetical protein